MYTAYIGLLTSNGLRAFCREGTQTQHQLMLQLRADELSRTCSVWFVMDDECELVVMALLRTGQREAAWMFIQDAARDFGVCDWDAEQRRAPIG